MQNTNSECHLTVFCLLFMTLTSHSPCQPRTSCMRVLCGQTAKAEPQHHAPPAPSCHENTNLDLLDRAHPMLRAFSYQVLSLVSLGQRGPLHGFAQRRVCGVVPSMWMLSLNTVPLAAFWIALFGRIRAFFSQISGAWEAAATQLSFPGAVLSQCVQKSPAQIQPLWVLGPPWSHDGRWVAEFVAFRPSFHSLHTEMSFSARKDITGDKTKDKLFGLISATWNTKLTFFSVILSDCHLLSSPKEIGNKRFIN